MRREDNELICRVGPGTPMGTVFRAYWTPIAAASQVERNDSDPVRAQYCGENYVLFRDSDGKLGLFDELCPHRGCSLALARVEERGIRCIYHGWKFAADGQCLDTPNHRDPNFARAFKAKTYPVRESGGLVWGYFGPREKQPEFPDFAFMHAPKDKLYVMRVDVACNYLQLLEGGMDSSHVGILHKDMAHPGWNEKGFNRNADTNNPGGLAVDDNAPDLSIETTDFGFHYAAIRRTPEGKDSIRVVPFIYPCARIIPARARTGTLFEVPLDDTHTSTYLIAFGEHTTDVARNRAMAGVDDPTLWNDKDFIWRATWDNRFGQDRSTMKTSWSGFRGLEQEDAAVSLSMGAIFDRSREHLVPADAAVVQLRQLLLQAARGVQNGGEAPKLPDLSKVLAVSDTELNPGQRWQDLTSAQTRSAA